MVDDVWGDFQFPDWEALRAEQLIKKKWAPEGVTLDPYQKDAVDAIIAWYNDPQAPFILAGYAGTGKSTLIGFIIDALKLNPDMGGVAFVAYTGKAAVTLRRKGLPATTVHRLIYEPYEDDDGVIRFRKRGSLASDLRLIVVDEASMVTAEMQQDLEKYRVPLLFVGDGGQLPPVGEPNDALMANPTFSLTKIHRQAQNNPIIKLATIIREGGSIPFGIFSDNVVKIRASQLKDDSLLNADQVLCGTNSTRDVLNRHIRKLHGLEGDYPVIGDKMICLKNDWQIGLVNGFMGYVIKPGKPTQYYGRPILAGFHLGAEDEGQFPNLIVDTCTLGAGKKPDFGVLARGVQLFDYGYAITVHKAQGSQYDQGIVFEEQFCNREMYQRWLYTAVTRFISKLIVVRS